MNIEKMKQFIALYNELKADRVIGFNDYSKGFHVLEEDLKGFENLKIKKRLGNDYPFEIYVEIDDFKIFALLTAEKVNDFPQFKDFARAELLKQLEALEKEEVTTV